MKRSLNWFSREIEREKMFFITTMLIELLCLNLKNRSITIIVQIEHITRNEGCMVFGAFQNFIPSLWSFEQTVYQNATAKTNGFQLNRIAKAWNGLISTATFWVWFDYWWPRWNIRINNIKWLFQFSHPSYFCRCCCLFFSPPQHHEIWWAH